MQNREVKNQRDWSRSVRARSDDTCDCCGTHYVGTYETRLEAHHLISKKANPLLQYDVNNGVVLCHTCHMLIHRFTDKRSAGIDEVPYSEAKSKVVQLSKNVDYFENIRSNMRCTLVNTGVLTNYSSEEENPAGS